MKFDVHLYAVVQVKVPGVEANSPEEAGKFADERTDLRLAYKDGKFCGPTTVPMCKVETLDATGKVVTETMLNDNYEPVVVPTSEELLCYDINDPNGPETWEEMKLPIKPFIVARYNLDEPYNPDKANMDWEATEIEVAMIGPNSFEFYDQDGYCLNECVAFRGKLPTDAEILDFLINLE